MSSGIRASREAEAPQGHRGSGPGNGTIRCGHLKVTDGGSHLWYVSAPRMPLSVVKFDLNYEMFKKK